MPGVFLHDPDCTIYQGDAIETLRQLPAESVHCVVTSPPFFNLRDYGCDGQIGLEQTPDQWASTLVAVFEQVKRVLRQDGTLWLECGDSYNAQTCGNLGRGYRHSRAHTNPLAMPVRRLLCGPKPKDLVGAPFLLAFALQAAGWYWRATNIWARPNPMPESAKDRCTTAHSYVFHFSRSPRYFFDAVAIQEPAAWERWGTQTSPKYDGNGNGKGDLIGDRREELAEQGSRHPRSVWTIPTEPNGLAICEVCGAYWNREAPQDHCGQQVTAHYAAFPRALAARCIKAGTSERGVCAECGAPWVRVVERRKNPTKSATGARMAPIGPNGETDTRYRKHSGTIATPPGETVGWQPSCSCSAATVPATILDPFGGSMTSALVARELGRRSIMVELREAYCALGRNRLSQLSLLAQGESA